MVSVPPKPGLGKSQALNIAQNTVQRLATLVPSLTTDLSPVTVYQPGATGGVGNQLIADTGGPGVVPGSYGVWVAPDYNGDGSDYYIQVECFGGGGGAGGGATATGGGGGGGAEYACETQYPVKPGQSYAYVVGLAGSGGFNNSTEVNPGAAGTDGGMTIFDIAGIGLANGVVANGGAGGDQSSVGVGGLGGTGSSNTIHYNGGAGGTNNSTNGGDNPLSLARVTGMFVGNTLKTSIIPCWWILNDLPPTGGKLNDSSGNSQYAYVTNFNGGLGLAQVTAPTQVPAYTATGSGSGSAPNSTAANTTAEFKIGALAKPSAQISASNDFTFAGSKLTVSAWVQCDPSGVWSNNPNTATGVIAANCQHYSVGTMGAGYALFWYNAGTSSSPNWQLYATVSNGTTAYRVSWTQGSPTPGQWLYVVMTYNAGTLSLYVNNVLKQTATTTGYTSVPGGGFVTRVGMDPNSATNWFFGSISNIWWANDCLTTAGMAVAYGATPPTAGGGGGASGGPSAVGGNGSSGAGATGGAGGVPTALPGSLSSTATAAMGGYAGANAAAGNSSPSAPAQGSYGAGGGGSGDMASSPALTVLTAPFSSAAAYCGPDATNSPGTPYSVNQQNNPNSGVTSVLFAGGAASDAGSGSKNSILLVPATLKSLLGTGKYTVEQVFLTFTNAMPTNPAETTLEIGYSADASLPQTYLGASLVSYIGAALIPSGAGTMTYDLTQSGIGALLQGGTATAFVLGPGATPTFDAYNSASGPDYYCSIYGPGAYDTFGNAEYPYLTVVLQQTLTTQQGSAGAGGAIILTTIDSYNTPVTQVHPYATTDNNGNQFAQGLTGQATAFDPAVTTPGSFVPETWKSITSFSGSWAAQGGGTPCRVKLLANANQVTIQGELNSHSGTGATIGTLPAAYWPSQQQSVSCIVSNSTGVTGQVNCISIGTNGVLTMIGPISATAAVYFMSGTYHLD